MEIGVTIPHTGRRASPDFVREWCTFAEEAGFGSLWGIDHVVMPRHVDSKYVLSRQPTSIGEDEVSNLMSPNFELVTTMAFVAAVTTRIKIGSSVAVLTIRNAVLNARQIATVDRYSGGRVLYGVGPGWLKEEANTMNMPWNERGARADEHIALLRALWTAAGKHVEFHGRFWDVPPMDPEPRPAQETIPILVGGHSEAAMSRAARLGDGWVAAGVSAERLSGLLPLLRKACDRHDRDPATLPVYCRGGRSSSTVDDIGRYAELGVHSLQLDISELEDLKRFAGEVLPHF